MKKHPIFLAASAILASSCATHSTTVEPAAEPPAISSETCAERLAIAPFSPSSLQNIGIVDSARQDLKLAFGFTATGTCVRSISSFENSSIVFDDATASLLVSGTNGYSLEPPRKGFDNSRNLDALKASEEISGALVLAAPVDTSNQGGLKQTYYVGLWETQDQTGYEVRAFSMTDGRLSSSPRTLIYTERTVRSISFTPSPDAPMGTINLVLNKEQETIEIVGIQWAYRDHFESFAR